MSQYYEKESDYADAVQSIVESANLKSKNGGFQYVLLLGAGASVSSHIPDGRIMCEALKKDYKVDEKHIKTYIDMGLTEYQAIFRSVIEKKGSNFLPKYIRRMILFARRPEPDNRWIINNCYNTIANILNNRGYFSRTVFTTNFDPLLYYAFIQNWNVEPVLIRHYHEIESMQPRDIYDEFPCLVYLHGYWQNHQHYHEPGQLDEFAAKWIDRLMAWLEHEIIVIGYSGLEDSIALKWLQKSLLHNKTVWWCIYSPTGKFDYDQCKLVENKIGVDSDNLRFLPIASADHFALDLGKKLKLSQAIEVSCADRVFPWFRPNDLSHFANGSSLNITAENSLALEFAMGEDPFPGNNHAGINIDSVEHELNIDSYNKIIVEYRTSSPFLKNAPGFEFKLHSRKNAWSYHVPLTDGKLIAHDIDLDKFRRNGVDLTKIWRVVIAADVKCFGVNGSATVSIQRTEIL